MLRVNLTGTAAIEDGATALWREFSAPLRSFLRARTRSDADADDLLQDVFVRIHKRLPGLRDPAKLQGWIYRIARNAVIDHYRARREHLPLDFELESEDPEGRDLVDLSRSLRSFIASLPAQYREPLLRHEFQGEPLQEVASALGLSLTATKSRVRRARMMLRKMLDQCCRFEFDRLGRVIEAIPRAQAACDASSRCDCDCEPGTPGGATGPTTNQRHFRDPSVRM